MNMDTYQQLADRFANRDVKGTDRMTMGALGISGESGELADEIKKIVYHKKSIDIDKIRKEIGDVLWYVAYIASVFDLRLSEIAEHNIEKLAKRHGDTFKPHDQQIR